MALLEELNARLAAIYKEAEAANLPINVDGADGCPPCNTVPKEECCVGCPYTMRDLGYIIPERSY